MFFLRPGGVGAPTAPPGYAYELMYFIQGRINHCAGCTMGGAPAVRGPRSTANFFHAVLTFRLNVTTTKKVVNFFFWGGEEKFTPEKHRQRKSWLRV